MKELSELLPRSLKGMTVREFESLRQDRRDSYAVSGFINPGKHYYDASNREVNDGIWCTHYGGVVNAFRMGRNGADANSFGSSLTDYPVYNVDGIRVVQNYVGASARNSIFLPESPSAKVETSTTTTNAYSRNEHVVVGNDIYLCTTDAPVGVLLTDTSYFTKVKYVGSSVLVGMEVFKVEVGDESGQCPVVYPYGNVQCRNGQAFGIGVQGDQAMPESYSAFGDWDTERNGIAGFGLVWSTLTNAQKNEILENPDHNIFIDGDKVYQWQYRIRSTPASGCRWDFATGYDRGAASYVRTSGTESGFLYRLSPQGSSTTVPPINNSEVFQQPLSNNYPADLEDFGVCIAPAEFLSGEIDNVYWLPIAIVHRFNKGAYHPFLNPNGTRLSKQSGVGGAEWWDVSSLAKLATTTADCFLTKEEGGVLSDFGATIQDPVSGTPFDWTYENVYHFQIDDLRLSAHGIELNADKYTDSFSTGRARGNEIARALRVERTTLESTDTHSVTLSALPSQTDVRGGCYLYNETRNEFTPAAKTGDDGSVSGTYFPINTYSSIYPFKYNRYSSSTKATLGDGEIVVDDWQVGDSVIVLSYEDLDYAYFNPPMLNNLFCNPTDLRTMMDNFNVDYIPNALWVAQLPDGTSKDYQFPRKIGGSNNYAVVSNDLSGIDWGFTSWSSGLNNTTEVLTFNFESGKVAIISQTSNAAPFLPQDIRDIGRFVENGVGSVSVAAGDRGVILGCAINGVVYSKQGQAETVTKQALQRSSFEVVGDQSGFSITNNGVIKHKPIVLENSNLEDHGKLDTFKYIPLLFESKDIPGLVSLTVLFKEMRYYHSLPYSPQVITLTASNQSVSIAAGERFIIQDGLNVETNNVGLVALQDIDQSWNNTLFTEEGGTVLNYVDNRLYTREGTINNTVGMVTASQSGDDHQFILQGLTMMSDLNKHRVLFGMMSLPRPLGFLPKEKR